MSYTLDDFRTAAAADGVNVIPFYDLRRDATSIADEVQRRKEDAKYDSSTFEKQKDGMLEEIKKNKEKINDIRKQIEDFKSQNPDGSVNTFEDDIKKCEREIEEYNGKIGDLNNEMARAVDAFERLYNARAGLREYFDKAKDQLRDVRSDPARYLGGSPSDDDLKKLQEYLRVIEGEIEDAEVNHKEQEDGAKKQMEKFRELIRKT